jgi:hypothetical protein
MTALHKSEMVTFSPAQAEETKGCSLFQGDGVELFSSGSAPERSSCFSGESTALFSSGSSPVALRNQSAGALVELFSSGSAPTAESTVVTGELSGLFSSGS